MKTLSLVVGLVQLATAAVLGLAALHADSVALIVLYAVCGNVNACLGVTNVLDALFGDDGLLFDITRKVNRDIAADDRKVKPRERSRITHPSAALRRRGARRRARCHGRTVHLVGL